MGKDKRLHTKAKRVAIVLSGCGALDGSEVQETICSILAIEEAGFSWKAYAPNAYQAKVVSYFSNKEQKEQRNMMQEAARLVRGKIEPMEALSEGEHDVLWMPGGYGVASSLSSLAEKGVAGKLLPKLDQLIKEFYAKKKPIVGICIAPALIAKSLQGKQIEITLGLSDEYASLLEQVGQRPIKKDSEQIVADKKHLIFSTPAFMNEDASCFTILSACRKIVAALH